MYQNIFDTHAHYDDEQFDPDREALLSGLPAQGICGVVNVACDLAGCQSSIALTERYDFIYASVGIHPHSASEFLPEHLALFADYAKRPKIVAIGEIGLDYHYDFSPREQQKVAFEAQLSLACDLDLPVIIHDREAHEDTMQLLLKYRPKGIVHCFSGSAEMAKEVVKLGMYVAFGGALTFQGAKKLVKAAAAVPRDRLLLETDCPYMAPVPLRGKRCDSSMIAYTAQTLAAIHQMDIQALIDQTTANARTVYSLP